MQSASDDDVQKRLLEKSRFELTWRKVYSDWEDVTGTSLGLLGQHYNRKTTATDRRLVAWRQKTIDAWSDCLPGRLRILAGAVQG